MTATAMFALAALYVDMRCVRCGLYRHYHVRGMNPLGESLCPTFTGMGR